jgi:hypothetical protein
MRALNALGRKMKRPVGIFVTTLVALIAGVAAAAWLATGTGNGYAKAGTAANLTFNDLTATVSATLYPGSSNVAYSYQIHNPNSYPVTVTNVGDPSGGKVVSVAAQGPTPGCTVANSAVSYNSPGAVSISVPAGGDSATTTFAGATMGISADDTCQGATFGLLLTATGHAGP